MAKSVSNGNLFYYSSVITVGTRTLFTFKKNILFLLIKRYACQLIPNVQIIHIDTLLQRKQKERWTGYHELFDIRYPAVHPGRKSGQFDIRSIPSRQWLLGWKVSWPLCYTQFPKDKYSNKKKIYIYILSRSSSRRGPWPVRESPAVPVISRRRPRSQPRQRIQHIFNVVSFSSISFCIGIVSYWRCWSIIGRTFLFLKMDLLFGFRHKTHILPVWKPRLF